METLKQILDTFNEANISKLISTDFDMPDAEIETYAEAETTGNENENKNKNKNSNS